MRNVWIPRETARSICHTKIINFLRSIVCLFWHVVGLAMDTVVKRLTSVQNITQPLSKIAWKRHTKAITNAAVNISNNSIKIATLDVKTISSKQHFIHTQGWFTRSHRSKRKCWWFLGLQRIFVVSRVNLFGRHWKSSCHSKNKLL